MMTPEKIRTFIATWEERATRCAAAGDREMYVYYCGKIWTADFILEDTGKADYQSAEERIPWPASSCWVPDN